MDLQTPGYHYNRLNNPTVDVLEQRITALEGGTAAMAVSSGAAAVSMSVLNLVAAGDNFVSVPQLYGATYTYFAHVLPTLGVEPASPPTISLNRSAHSSTGAPRRSSARPSATPPATSSTSPPWPTWPTRRACR